MTTGFCIFAGELINQPTLTGLLQNHQEIHSIVFGTESLELLQKVTSFSLRQDGSIQFLYQWDEPLSYNYRGETRHVVRTFNFSIRIITGEHYLYFLVEKYADISKSREAMVRLSKLIYGPTQRILNAYIDSDLIKQIEGQDSQKVEVVWFRGVSSLDKAVGLFGELDIRREDGTRGHSEEHRRLKNREQTSSQFLSYSRPNVRIYISANKNSVSLRAPRDANIGLNDVEQYIRHKILPRIIVASSD